MLTGDKLETAINIGKSTNIISKNSELIVIDGFDHNEIFLQLNKYYSQVIFFLFS
jgi:magnesium-transporting ATPase (P-type)